MARKKLVENKSLKIEVLNPKKAKPEFELLLETSNPKIDRLIEVYKENPQHARVLFVQAKENYKRYRTLKFTYSNGDINIIKFENSFGISINNRMYNTEKNMGGIIWKAETQKWYLKSPNMIKHLCYYDLYNFVNVVNLSEFKESRVFRVVNNMIPWLRNLTEDKTRVSHSVPFNTIISHKLFNLISIYKHIFKVPVPVIRTIMGGIGYDGQGEGNIKYFISMWGEMKKVLINVESLTEQMFHNHYFKDTCKMAASLNRKVNCSWGLNRLKLEHDAWAKEISNILLLNQKNTKMRIRDVYMRFRDYSKYTILETDYDMIHDGLIMRHCVATYINAVNNGKCAIFKVDGHTMEINYGPRSSGYGMFEGAKKKILYFTQIKGYMNKDASEELKASVQKDLDYFNEYLLDMEEVEEVDQVPIKLYEEWAVDLPF